MDYDSHDIFLYDFAYGNTSRNFIIVDEPCEYGEVYAITVTRNETTVEFKDHRGTISFEKSDHGFLHLNRNKDKVLIHEPLHSSDINDIERLHQMLSVCSIVNLDEGKKTGKKTHRRLRVVTFDETKNT